MRLVYFFLTLTVLAAAGVAQAQGSAVPPRVASLHAIACSNVAQDFSQAASDAERTTYWVGNSAQQYVTQLLAEPQAAFSFNLTPPVDRTLYPRLAGQAITYVALVCHPTTADNPRPDYPINAAQTRVVPRMQRSGEVPLFADPVARYPVVLFSHGIYGDPLTAEYLNAITLLASQGYVVVAPFHGDGRFGSLSIGAWSDLTRLLFQGGFQEIVELQALRPLSLQSALDRLLAHPDYRDHVDAARIGGFGISLGGESLLLLAGAELTTHFYPQIRSAKVVQDGRLQAIAGYVPYFGQSFLPAFGDHQIGVSAMRTPFLGISGTADMTAPIAMAEAGVNRMPGPRYLVAIQGLGHTFRAQDIPDIFTWTLTFFDAYLNAEAAAAIDLARMTEVQGGAVDALRLRSSPLFPTAVAQRIDCFFGWAERNYQNVLAPANAVSRSLDPYYYRYYSGSNAYLAVSTDQNAYYLGPQSNQQILNLGPASAWYDAAGCN